MNSLPPELLSSIVEQAAQCDSTYSSYRSRVQILSALSLVNRTFRQLAQPLLPRKVWFRNESELERFEGIGRIEKVASLRVEDSQRLLVRYHVPQWAPTIDFEHFALPNVEEVSLERLVLILKGTAALRTTIRFLAPSHFPSLRAVGIKAFRCYDSIGTLSLSPVSTDYSLVNQLDCITLDENGYQDWIQSHQTDPGASLSSSFSTPLLFNIDSTVLPSSSVALVCTKAHFRTRLTSESTPNRLQIENALFLVQDLLTRSKVLQEIYLDFCSRGGSGGYQLDADLEGKLERLEVLAKEKKVEIIWETKGDNWCKSMVSREFWRRCKEKKEKALENE